MERLRVSSKAAEQAKAAAKPPSPKSEPAANTIEVDGSTIRLDLQAIADAVNRRDTAARLWWIDLHSRAEAEAVRIDSAAKLLKAQARLHRSTRSALETTGEWQELVAALAVSARAVAFLRGVVDAFRTAP